MNAHTKIQAEVLPPEDGGTDIMAIVEQTPQIVLLDTAKYDAFYERVKAETDKLVPDTSTAKGRDEIRSMATKVTKAKTGLDKARLALTKDWREKTEQVNAAGKKIEADLTQLAADVRKPLTDWEEADKARIAECEAVIARLRQAAIVTIDDTVESVMDRGREVRETVLDAERYGSLFEQAEQAEQAKTFAFDTLRSAYTRLKKEADDRAEAEKVAAELAELKAAEAERQRIADEEKAEREATERAAQEKREAEERAAAKAKEDEERQAAAEQAEKERIARAEQEAEERAKRQAEADAQAERDRIQREHEEQLAAERKKAAEEAAAKQAELDRLAQIEADRKAEEERVAAEQARREADQAHRTKVKTAAKTALMTCGADEETARKIVVAILAGEIPAVRLEF